jgi:hypothetical protein
VRVVRIREATDGMTGTSTSPMLMQMRRSRLTVASRRGADGRFRGRVAGGGNVATDRGIDVRQGCRPRPRRRSIASSWAAGEFCTGPIRNRARALNSS